MKASVTSKGVLIPRELLENIKEVEIRADKDRIIVLPVGDNDIIKRLGKSDQNRPERRI